MSDVTQILSAIDQGDAQATEQFLPLVYDVQNSVNGRSIRRTGTHVMQTNDAFGVDHHVAPKLAGVSGPQTVQVQMPLNLK